MALVTGALISGAASLIGGLFGASKARKQELAAQKKARAAQKKLDNLINSRQEIINPYENTKDLSGSMSNAMAGLGVATQAAEMQAEQADISLANTLDTVRATGASAGGATALAQAALQSKKGVSANIEAQEASNDKARAQGEQNLQARKIAEKQRIQGADAQGKTFEFNARETREVAEMDRISAQIDGANQQAAQASANRTSAITGAIGGISSVAGSYLSAQGAVDAATAGNVAPTRAAVTPVSNLTPAGVNSNMGQTMNMSTELMPRRGN